jgi:hypothetical protein
MVLKGVIKTMINYLYRFLTIFYYFFKELLFDFKEEYIFNEARFNPRKFFVLGLFALSLYFNAYLCVRLYHLAQDNLNELHEKSNCIIINKK